MVLGVKSFPPGWIPIVLLACAFLGSMVLPFEGNAAEKPGKIKLLIIEGVSNHDWKHRLALVQDILARDCSFEVTVSVTPSATNDPAWDKWRPDFGKYDVVLSAYNNLGGKAGWPTEVQQTFEKYVHG